MALDAGTMLGPYEIAAPIGAGGMGEVYRARDTRLHRDVAVKVLPPAVSADPDRLRRFEQEARAVAALNHPNILALHESNSSSRSSSKANRCGTSWWAARCPFAARSSSPSRWPMAWPPRTTNASCIAT